ncbi:MAG: DnaD domain protein [Chloroflexi bacterium]|nr:DnaD domain protein [Chloroflexota bacterium]
MNTRPQLSTSTATARAGATIRVPTEFWDRVLERSGDTLELKLVLRVIRVIASRPVGRKYVKRSDVRVDKVLIRLAQTADSAAAPNVIETALERALDHGLLQQILDPDTGENTRIIVDIGQAYRYAPSEGARNAAPVMTGATAESESPDKDQAVTTVFQLYEANIGLVTPLIADALSRAVERYPEEWIKDAVTIAVELNKRSWRYIQRILERWETEGKDDGANRSGAWAATSLDRYTKGRYGKLIES